MTAFPVERTPLPAEEEYRIRFERIRMYGRRQIQYANDDLQYPENLQDKENESENDDCSDFDIDMGGPEDLIYSLPSTPFSIHVESDTESENDSDENDESDSAVVGDDENSDTDDC